MFSWKFPAHFFAYLGIAPATARLLFVAGWSDLAFSCLVPTISPLFRVDRIVPTVSSSYLLASLPVLGIPQCKFSCGFLGDRILLPIHANNQLFRKRDALVAWKTHQQNMFQCLFEKCCRSTFLQKTNCKTCLRFFKCCPSTISNKKICAKQQTKNPKP